MLRLPNNPVQKALYQKLKTYEEFIGAPTYDFVPDEAKMPFVTLGNTVTTNIGNKTEDNTKIEVQINIWSEYKGKYQINNIAERIINLLMSQETGYLDCEAEGFIAYEQAISTYEAYPEDATGYNAVIGLEVHVKNFEATAEEI
jgi:hypothetical protein